MLRLRVMTAFVMVALLIPSVFLMDDRSWGLLVAVIAGLAGWEYARLVRFPVVGQVVYGAAVGSLLLVFSLALKDVGISTFVFLLAPFSVIFWLLIAPFWLRSRWELRNPPLLVLLGLVLLLPTWVALVAIRAHGPEWLLLVLGGVALADIAAYFSGRRFGKRKLALEISPGKTWEGAWGAMVAVTILVPGALLLSGAVSFLPTPVLFVVFVVAMPFLVLLSIAGDLFESLLKRQSGFKDSSNLLPGHGGVLDRIDSYVSTLPLVAFFLQFI